LGKQPCLESKIVDFLLSFDPGSTPLK